MPPLPVVAALAGVLQTGGAQAPVELLILSRTGPDSVLVARARRRPDEARDALHRLFVLAADSAPAAPLAAATRLAQAYAAAWRDSFLLRQVARFAAWSPAERAAKLAADSLRRAGNAALGHAGVDAALHEWRASLARRDDCRDRQLSRDPCQLHPIHHDFLPHGVHGPTRQR